MSDLVVTLKRHTGMRNVGYGVTREVDCGQDMVFVNGQFAGYAPDEGQISLVSHGAAEEVKQAIMAEVDRLKGRSQTSIVDVPVLEESNVVMVADEDSDEPLS